MTLIYDATTRSSILGISMFAGYILVLLGGFLLAPIFTVVPRWRVLPRQMILKKASIVLLVTGFLVSPMLIAIVVVSNHLSAQSKALDDGNFLSATGRLGAVKFHLFGGGGRGRRSWFTEHDVLTLSEGNAFEIECGRVLPEEPDRTGVYTCLNAQIGDDLTVESTVGLGMHGAVPALRVWRKTGG